MSEAVTDIIVSRNRQGDGLTPMVVWSLAAHAAVAAAVMLAPSPPVDTTPQPVMMISLGGAPGPKTDGMTQIGGQSVQARAAEKPRVATPPAPEQPKMTVPETRTPARQRPRPEQAPEDARGRTLSTGEETRSGSTPVDTKVRGQGFGLASAGGAGGQITVDVANFCCTEYLTQLSEQVRRNWNGNQGIVGLTRVKFVIQRNGRLDEIQVERSSGFAALDQAALRALQVTQQVAPLPAPYINPTLTVHLDFEYRR